jgi:hypothetical protein
MIANYHVPLPAEPTTPASLQRANALRTRFEEIEVRRAFLNFFEND